MTLRRSGIGRGDPEKRRKFIERGRKPLGRTGKGLTRKRPERPDEGPLTPSLYEEEVFTRAGGLCSVTGRRAKRPSDRSFHAHHPLPKDELRRRGLYEHVWDPRNGVWVDATLHMDHEHGSNRKIPRTALPASVWNFARQMDALGGQGDGPEWATALVERLHPDG